MNALCHGDALCHDAMEQHTYRHILGELKDTNADQATLNALHAQQRQANADLDGAKEQTEGVEEAEEETYLDLQRGLHEEYLHLLLSTRSHARRIQHST